MTWCYGFHVGSIPADTDEVVTTTGEHWHRAGPRSWNRGDLPDPGPRMHESWLLAQGPVRCPVVERVLADRNDRLAAELVTEDEPGWLARLPDHPADAEPLVFEDAMMLMRAGWLAWGAKQRRESLASIRETEKRELAVTS